MEIHQKKFLWFVYDTHNTIEEKEVALTEMDLTLFQTYFRWKLLEKLGPDLKMFKER